MNLVLFYFSGTGNTRYIAHHLCDRLNDSGYEATAASIEGLNFLEAHELIDNSSAVGLAWPIYGSDIPNNMKQFIKAMPIAYNKPLLTFCTQLLFSGDGAVVMSKALESKGYVQKWAVQFNMPNNFIVIGVSSKGKDDYSIHEQKYLIAARKKIERLKDNIISGTKYISGATIGHTILAMSQRPAYKLFGYNIMKNWFDVNDKCTGCALCVQMCPKRVIEMVDGKAVYKNRDECLLCFRCSNFCPHSAITFLKTVKSTRFKGPDEQTYKSIITDKKA